MSPTPHARERVGAAVRAERKSRLLSIESAAKAGGIGHMTWRKIERGGSVHDQSYYAVDRAFGWQSGHTRAVVQSDDEDLTPAPPSDPGLISVPETESRSLAREETSATSRDEDSLSSDAFYTILEHIDMITLPELKAISTVIEVRLRERTEVLDSVKKRFNLLDWSVPRFRVDYLATTPPEVGDEYQSSYGAYMNAWADMQEVASIAHECETKRAASLPELQQLWERAQRVGDILDKAVKRFNAAEENATKNQEYELLPSKPSRAQQETEEQ